jgi:tRNA(fMet)-specific endonuclease VapC
VIFHGIDLPDRLKHLSEFTKKQPNSNVLLKLEQTSGQFCTCVTVWHELQYGIERLEDSKRKLGLLAYLESLENAGLQVLAYEKTAVLCS